MRKIELLAPAKNYETAIVAINSGADAIYIGASEFGARYNAANSIEDIEKIVKYAHKFYVRVHITINTILNNEEVNRAIELIKKLYNIGVDAIIVQDMAIIKAAIDGKLPPIQIHISTQGNNRELEKVKFFDKIGASRVVLARELSLSKIKEICKNTDCEIETFIHGALCVSYSGQCYLSYANGGRSANRGECAQPCRKVYSLVDYKGNEIISDKYLLSLKDFNATEQIKNLIDAGVNSFKIEGRLKDINYVKNVVLHYHQLTEKLAKHTSSGKVYTNFKPDVNKTFNRRFTDYFLKERTTCANPLTPKFMGENLGKIKEIQKDYFILNSKSKVVAQDGLCFVENSNIQGFLVNKVVGNKIYPNKMPKLKKGIAIYKNQDIEFEKELKNAKIERKIDVKFIIEDNGIWVKDVDFNRVFLEFNSKELPQNKNSIKETYKNQLSKTGNSGYNCVDVVFNTEKYPFMPVSEINNFRRELFKLLDEERLKNYPKLVQKSIKYRDFHLSEIDYRGNVFNNEAEEFYKNCNCQITEKALESQTNIKAEIELMRTKHCIKYAFGYCGQNLGKTFLLDKQTNKKYPVIFDCKNCEMVIKSS